MLDLTCYLQDGWKPLIKPASRYRDWMGETPERFAYRCLPLTIANAHGWEIINPSPFEVRWDGQQAARGLTVTPLAGAALLPVSHFGSGVLTWHVNGLFRTSPGWNLFVSGSPNRFKDGIFPLTGIVETDWTAATFTMNWMITRPNHTIRFDAGEPFCFFFPVQRGVVDSVKPEFRPMSSNPETDREHREWSDSRELFNYSLKDGKKIDPKDAWQKDYTLGVKMSGERVEDHQTKIFAAEFAEYNKNEHQK